MGALGSASGVGDGNLREAIIMAVVGVAAVAEALPPRPSVIV